MSKNFSNTHWKRFLLQEGGRGMRRVVAGGIAIVFLAVAAWFTGGTHVLAAQAGKTDSETVPAGNAERGKELYTKDGCYQCHGYLGQGGTSWGRRLAPAPLPWEAIAAYIRKPTGAMPPYTSKLVPDRDVIDIYAYLNTMPGPTDIKNVPTFTSK